MFPGQGTQKPGMLNALGSSIDKVNEVFEIANDVTGRDVRELCLSASAEELVKTENTQVAVTAMNLAYLKLLDLEGVKPDIVLGHSLGQFSAFAAAGVLTTKQVFEVVQKRAELMGNIKREGMLCTILGMDYMTVEQICHEINPNRDNLVVALYNTPNQIVIGGDPDYVLKAEEACKAKGALRTVPVKVSNAFHTPLMKEMEEEFSSFIDKTVLSAPKCRLMLNCKADYAESVDDIKKEIIEQCCHTVNWCDGVKKVISDNSEIIFAEVGVGKVLTGMLRSIDKDQHMMMMSDSTQFEKFLTL